MSRGSLLVLLVIWLACGTVDASLGQTPEERAVAYLAREAPAWRPGNGCFSCHHDGDATRVLMVARAQGLAWPEGALTSTIAWLEEPSGWEHNGGEGPFSDKKLARLQFSQALLTGIETGASDDREALAEAAEALAADQQDDGSWKIEGGAQLGSALTYGPILATGAAVRVLGAQDDDRRFGPAIQRARAYLAGVEPKNVFEAASLLCAADERAVTGQQVEKCLALLRRGQAAEGGWGPFENSPPEPFDTAVAVLGLVKVSRSGKAVAADLDDRLKRGREYLAATQLEDGSWPETTRPPGAESYAQRVSTTAWATLALLRSKPLFKGSP